MSTSASSTCAGSNEPEWYTPGLPLVRKSDEFPGSARLEGQGLSWLGEPMARGGAFTVPVRFGAGWIEEPRLQTCSPTAEAARAFGRALAVTHAAGAPAFGVAPPGWDGVTRMGRSNIRLRACEPEAESVVPRRWGEFYANDRIAPYIKPGRDNGSLSAREAALIERVCERLCDGDFDAEQPALVEAGARERGERVAVARTHGDLWCGNVLWAQVEDLRAWAPECAGMGPGNSEAAHPPVAGVLIDPLAQGAHAETDLAALGVFGQPYLAQIVAGYDEVSPLADGWAERVRLHQLHMLMIHVFLFGGGYGSEAAAAARPYC